MPPKITDIANISDIKQLRFRPSRRAGSAHLMTPVELEEATNEARRRYARSPKSPNHADCLRRFLDEQERRQRETPADRANRLRLRIAWEVAQEKREGKSRFHKPVRY